MQKVVVIIARKTPGTQTGAPGETRRFFLPNYKRMYLTELLRKLILRGLRLKRQITAQRTKMRAENPRQRMAILNSKD